MPVMRFKTFLFDLSVCQIHKDLSTEKPFPIFNYPFPNLSINFSSNSNTISSIFFLFLRISTLITLQLLMVRIIQNYTLYEIIGQGAYGKVYRATNKNDNKEYAVKVIQVRRFKENKKLEECTVNEINILTNIEKNEHIIKYIDMLKTPNNFYFVYQFCNGGTLESVLRKDKFINEKEALLIFKQLIDAFQVLNKYNIMHRDLKPDNIFFSNGVVKLGDFGFCKSLEKANMTKTMLGSPIYMAPQILRGQIYSTKADIWSLGVVLYEMLYGFCPFESTTIPKLIEVLKQTELEFPNNPPVSQETKRLVRRLLTKDPTKRIQWMELLKVNITNDGKLANDNRGLLSFTEEQGNILDNVKLLQSSKFTPIKEVKQQRNDQIQSYSPQSSFQSESTNYSVSPPQGGSFLKKKAGDNTVLSPTSAYSNRRLSDQDENTVNFKKLIQKEHAEVTRGFHVAVDLIKSNDTNAVLFAFLVLKKAEQRLVAVRDEVANNPEYKQLLSCLNFELKDINQQLSKYPLNEDLKNWKALVKATGQFHRNFRAFYMMVLFMAGETPKDDVSHVEMQMEVRSKLS